MRTKYKKYQEGGELPAREGRLSGKERRKLRQLRRQVRQGGGNRKSSVGLTAEEANIKNRLENRRRQNVADDFRRGVNAAAIAAGAGIIGKAGGFKRLGDAVKGLKENKELVELVKKGAGPIENKAKGLAQRALMKPKSADQESFMNTMDVIANDPKFAEFGSTKVGQYAQPAGGDNVPDMDADKASVNKLLSALGGFQGRPDAPEAPEALESLPPSTIPQGPVGAPTPIQSIMASPIAQNIVKPNLPEDVAKASKALGDFAGKAGLAALFADGGKVGDPKKKEAMKLIALNEADYDNNLGDFFRAGEMAKADSVLQTMNDRYKRIVELGYGDKANDSLPYDKLKTLEDYGRLVEEQKAEDNR